MVTRINATFVSVIAVVGAWRPSIHLIPAGLFCISRIPDAANDENRETTLVRVIDIGDLSKSIHRTHDRRTYVDCCIFKFPPPLESRTLSSLFDVVVVWCRRLRLTSKDCPTNRLMLSVVLLYFPPSQVSLLVVWCCRFRSTFVFVLHRCFCLTSSFFASNADFWITSPSSLFVVNFVVVVVVVVCRHCCSPSLLFIVVIVRRRRCSSLSLFVVLCRCCSSSSLFVVVVVRHCCCLFSLLFVVVVCRMKAVTLLRVKLCGIHLVYTPNRHGGLWLIVKCLVRGMGEGVVPISL